MGTIIEATCECGYTTRMFLGGGFHDFTECNAFPYFCAECSDLTVLNSMDAKPCCGQCQGSAVTSYSDPSMFLGQPLCRAVHQWGEYPSSDILRAPSAEAYADASVQALSDEDGVDLDKLLSEMGTDLKTFRTELAADYQAKWEKIRSGEYHTLYDCSYPCPRCNQRTLYFENAGHWD